MNALLLGYYGSRNLGDDMMMACLLDALHAQNVHVTVISENPSDTTTRFGVPSIRNVALMGQWKPLSTWLGGSAFRLISKIRECDALIVGGGDLIRDEAGWKTFFYTAEKIFLALLFRRPVYLINMGFSRPRTGYARRGLGIIFKRSRLLIARDMRSVELYREYTGSDCLYAPDVVLHLPHMVYGSSPPSPPPPSRCGYVVVCLRGRPNTYGRYDLQPKHLQVLAAGLDYLVGWYGLRVVFLPFQDGEEWGDEPLQTAVLAHMQRAFGAVSRKWSGDFKDVMECVGNARFVLAMRLHSAVLALALRRPCLLMPYDEKVTELARQFGIGDAVLPENLEDPETLKKSWDDYLAAIDTRVPEPFILPWQDTVFRRFLEKPPPGSESP